MNDMSTGQPDSLTRVLSALVTLGEATAAAVAEQAGLAYSSTTPKLRALEEGGQAVRVRDGDGRTLWRPTTTSPTGDTTATVGADPAAADTPPAHSPGEAADPEADDDRAAPAGDQPSEPTPPQLGETSDGRLEDAEDQVSTPDTQEGAPEDVEVAPTVEEPGAGCEQEPEQSNEQPPALVPDVAEQQTPDAATQPAQAPADEPTAPEPIATEPAADGDGPDRTGSRRAAGSLRGAILDILEAHPDRQYKTGELCKLIDQANDGTGTAKASPGAVFNAAIKLAAAGKAVQTVDRPATFQLATGE